MCFSCHMNRHTGSNLSALQDILLNFRTAFVDEMGDVVTGYRPVASNYLQSWFLIDFVSVFPLDIIVADGQLGLLRLFKSVRCASALCASWHRGLRL